MDGKTIIAKVGELHSLRSTVEDQWEIIKQLVTPYRGNFFDTASGEGSIEWRENRRIFDSTAVNANNTLASSLHGALTSPAIRWFDLTFRADDLNANKEAREWLEECSKIIYRALQDSNFNLEANETYLDLTSYGTSVIVEEVLESPTQEFEELVFQSVPVEQVYFEQDHRGRVNRLYRKLRWSPLQIKTKFGDKIPDSIKDMVDAEKTADNQIEIIFAIYPIDKNKDADTSKPLTPENRPFGYKYVLRNGGEMLGEEGGYYEMPAFIPRWRKTSDSMWGNSPAMSALPDILTLNQLVELILTALEKVVDPAILTTERGLLTDLDLGAGGVNIVRKMDELAPFESRSRFDVAELHRDKLQQSIRSAFHVDQLELKESPAMTATEVQVRYELMQRLLGPTMGRLQNDYLDPMIQLTFNNLFRYGQFPEVPQVIVDADSTMDVMYSGPLARAQKADVAGSVERWIGGLAQLAEVNPELLDIPDWDAIAKHTAMLQGVPAKLIKTDTAIKELRRERADAQKEQQQAEVDKTQGEADLKHAQAGNEEMGGAA
jgi:hypothetical protein